MAEARARLGPEYRRLAHAIAGHLVDADTLDVLTTDLARWSDRLDAFESRDRVTERPTGDWGPPPGTGEAMWWWTAAW